jgi:tRNA dimethylallyltransferase
VVDKALVERVPGAVLLTGPTASGKSLLAWQLAQQLPVEIVSVDSAQVYAGMDIGTAKPSPAERAAVPHHLIDIVSPVDSYSAAKFRSDAGALIRDIHARGRLPLLVGGTMLYFKALREGLAELPDADPGERAAIDAEAAEAGWPAMHQRLSELDPATAQRIKPNDSQRIQRALEVIRLTGTPMSEVLKPRSETLASFRFLSIALIPSDRTRLHERIAERFSAMLDAGLVEELHALRSRLPLRETAPSMRCVGYRQAWQFLEGRLSEAELRDRGIYATRQFAKRQLTWLRSMENALTVDCFDPGTGRKVLDRVRQFFAA